MSWHTTITYYEEIKHRVQKRVPCTGCGKELRRQQTFIQTINPWNKDARGNVKTPQQIKASLVEEGNEWKTKPETCSACLEK
jgi:hypothetical protein